MKYSKGPWTIHKTLNDVWNDEPPICDVISGVWGDRYPNIRLVKDDGGISTKVEAFMDMMEYGEINSEEAEANKLLIAASPDMYEALIKIIKMNLQMAKDKYGDSSRVWKWNCVEVAKEALEKATGQCIFDILEIPVSEGE